MNFNINFPKSFYINEDLFTTFEADIRAAYNDPSRVGTLNRMQVRPVAHRVLQGWSNDMRHHFKQTYRFGFLAITSILVAGIASAILVSPISAIVAGSLGVLMFTACVINMFSERKQLNSTRDLYTQQRALAIGPIELIIQKEALYTEANGMRPHLQHLSEEISFVNPGTFTHQNMLPWISLSNSFELFQRCFIFQQANLDGVKKLSNSGEPHGSQVAIEIQNFVIDWYKGNERLTPLAQTCCDLVDPTPPTDARNLNDPAVKACRAKYFPNWYIAQDNLS